MPRRKRTIAGIDLGSSKVTSVIADVSPDEIVVRGINSAPTRSIVKGVIRDLNQCAAEIDASFSGAVYASGVHVDSVHLAVTSKDLVSVPRFAEIRLESAQVEISQQHIDRLFDSIRETASNKGYIRLQRIVQEFEVNETRGVRNPLGMFGERLAVRVQDIIGPEWLLNNYKKALDRLGLKVVSLIPSILCAGEAVLTTEEKNTGCILLDLGHGTTDAAIYRDGSAAYTDTIPVGVGNFETDFMQGLGVSLEEAQRIRRSFFKAWTSSSQPDAEDIIDIKFYGHAEFAKIKRQKVMEVALPRLEEWSSLIRRSLRDSGMLESVPGGVVLSGGGAFIREIVGFFRHHLGKPVRIGIPRGYSHLFEEFRAPQYASALGITSFAGAGEREEAYGPGFLENVADFFLDLVNRVGKKGETPPKK